MPNRTLMERAIEIAKESATARETDRSDPTPIVGAVIAQDGVEQVTGYRGENGPGTHAEFVALEKLKALLGGNLSELDLSEYEIYATLEPCTVRSAGKDPCANRIARSGIKTAVIGILDPNRIIQGDGYWHLTEDGIRVSFFDVDLVQQIRSDNDDFIRHHKRGFWRAAPDVRRLDGWYNSINAIYSDRNLSRTPVWILSHLTEIVGGLSWIASEKRGQKPGVSFESYVAKGLAWWFALCGQMGIRSVEELLWLKFPKVCAYCEQRSCIPECSTIKETRLNPRWDVLADIGVRAKAAGEFPSTLEDWRRMFRVIYPPSGTGSLQVVFPRFSEEIGELSECVRVFELVPTSFLSEAADVFAWLMHLVSLYEVRKGVSISLADVLYARYPDRCRDCKSIVCSCPPILPRTVRRMAHDGPSLELAEKREIFMSPADRFARFSPGDAVITLGGVETRVGADLVRQVYEFAQSLRSSIRALGEQSPYLSIRVDTWCTAALELATRQRVRSQQLEGLTKIACAAEAGERETLVRLISSAPQSDVQSGFLAAML